MEHLRLLHGPQSGPHREPEPGPDQQVLHPRRGRDGDVAGKRRQWLRQPAVGSDYQLVWHVDARQCEDWPVPAGTQQRSELFPERDHRYLGYGLDCHVRLGSTPFRGLSASREKEARGPGVITGASSLDGQMLAGVAPDGTYTRPFGSGSV